MKISKLPFILVTVLGITLFISYIRWKPSTPVAMEKSLPHLQLEHGRETVPNEILYGIMFDAGSTGTRIHVYKFKKISSDPLHLENEIFKAIKPGLSAYADDPGQCAAGIKELLDIAKEEIPGHLWRSTPLVLKATAGLRLLPGEKAQKLLDTVTDLFQSFPFLVGKDSVSIMNSTDEGIFAWITVNVLTGSITHASEKLSGMLDLGGGSTQITFYPYDKNTFPSAPAGYITNFDLFNNTYHLYSHSYLGLGLMSARLQIMGGEDEKPLQPGDELVTPCITPGFITEFKQAGISYKVNDVTSLYESCYRRVSKMLSGKVSHAKEVSSLFFYAFSDYFDRAEDARLIDPSVGGFIKVADFEMRARKECTAIEKTAGSSSSFLKITIFEDCTYIYEIIMFEDSAYLSKSKKLSYENLLFTSNMFIFD
ncbi:ectonucleoside triphosphate diphosphohydrolase 6-like [Pseudophryne corroboree]|uniref:ectonucleoside triphosphate diphosphohydrolase 6-like n=1 Tax=Pseudophryne corroboree TaxID=495146 RepID=UPI003081C82F